MSYSKEGTAQYCKTLQIDNIQTSIHDQRRKYLIICDRFDLKNGRLWIYFAVIYTSPLVQSLRLHLVHGYITQL